LWIRKLTAKTCFIHFEESEAGEATAKISSSSSSSSSSSRGYNGTINSESSRKRSVKISVTGGTSNIGSNRTIKIGSINGDHSINQVTSGSSRCNIGRISGNNRSSSSSSSGSNGTINGGNKQHDSNIMDTVTNRSSLVITSITMSTVSASIKGQEKEVKKTKEVELKETEEVEKDTGVMEEEGRVAFCLPSGTLGSATHQRERQHPLVGIRRIIIVTITSSISTMGNNGIMIIAFIIVKFVMIIVVALVTIAITIVTDTVIIMTIAVMVMMII